MLKATPAGHPLWIDTTANVSARAAVSLVVALQARLAVSARAVLLMAADDALDELYYLLVKHYRRAVDWRRVCIVQTDEFLELPAGHRRSQFARLQNALFKHLEVGEIFAIDGRLQASPELIDRQIDALGGIDIAVHSLGENGQVGLNGPGSPFNGGARRAALTATKHGLYSWDFDDLPAAPRAGVTVGLKTVAETAFNLVFAFGHSRAWATAQAIYGPVAEAVPGSLFQRLNNVHYYLDHAAYSDCKVFSQQDRRRELALEF